MAVARIVAVFFLSCVALLALVLNIAIVRGDRRRLAVAARWTRKWGEWACGALGIEVVTHGPQPPAGSLLVSNHVSYLDIISMSSATGCFFTPKAELRTWPLVGMLSA